MQKNRVYAMTDSQGRVIDVRSDAFVSELEGWQRIDEGEGDRYLHAKGNYLPGGMKDERGICRYKILDGELVARTREEMDTDDVPHKPRRRWRSGWRRRKLRSSG